MKRLQIPEQSIELFPFGDTIRARDPEERVLEEVYQSIPALSALADTTVALSNRMTGDARNALFFAPAGAERSLRQLSVELALKRRHEMETAQPDSQYLGAEKAAKRRDYETPEPDIWIQTPDSEG